MRCPKSIQEAWWQLDDILNVIPKLPHGQEYDTPEFKKINMARWVVIDAKRAILEPMKTELSEFNKLIQKFDEIDEIGENDDKETRLKVTEDLVKKHIFENGKLKDELEFPYAALVRIAVGHDWVNLEQVNKIKWKETTSDERVRRSTEKMLDRDPNVQPIIKELTFTQCEK